MSDYSQEYASDPFVVSSNEELLHPELPQMTNKHHQQMPGGINSNDQFTRFNTNRRTNLSSMHLSDISNLTVNDTTASSIENDLELLEPVSFDEDNRVPPSNFDIYQSTNRPLTLNDLHSSDANHTDSVHGYLNMSPTEANDDKKDSVDNSIANDSDDSDFNMGDFRLTVDLDDLDFNMDFDLVDLKNDESSADPVHSSQSENSAPHSHTGSNVNTNTNTNSNSNLTDYPSTNSNVYTPQSKILNNADISTEDLKRSFTRLKQTSELLNTEKVYICSLKILEKVYLNNFMSDLTTPIYFETFRKCVIKLLKSHQFFYDSLLTIYQKWYDDSVALLNSDSQQHDGLQSSSLSPNFEKYNYVSNEKNYLEIIVKLICNLAIDVDTYSTYCSLYQQVLTFSNPNNIEKYKRDSLIILNDYLVEHKNLHDDLFIDKHLDTRFISVVQMPTTRMVRYKLILLSLLKNIELDEKNKAQQIYYNNSINKLNDKIDAINNYVGNQESKFAKLEMFRKLFSRNNKNLFPNTMFLENLEDLQLASSFGVVYPTLKNSNVASEYLCGFLFKSHLILAKASNIHSNSLEVKFIIPLMSIFNMEYSTCLSTTYHDVITLTFEERFNVFEVALIFPDEKELLLWQANLKININKLNFNNDSDTFFQHKYIYSDIQRKVLSIELNDESERFNVSSLIPQSIKPVRQNSNGDEISNDICLYEIDHFTSDFNAPKKRNRSDSVSSEFDTTDISSITTGNITRASTLQSINNKYHTIKITVQERCAAQTCIASIWSNQFELYTMSMSISRSLSNMFHSRLSLLSLVNTNANNNTNNSISNNTPTSNNTVPNTPNSQFIPPSPSFANSNGQPRSPARLRNSKSTRTFQDICRTPPVMNSHEDFRKPNLPQSTSLLSLSNIIPNGLNSSSRSIISVSTANDTKKTRSPRKIHQQQLQRPSTATSLLSTKKPTSATVEPGLASPFYLPKNKFNDSDSFISTSSTSKISSGVKKLWKSIQSSSSKRSKNT